MGKAVFCNFPAHGGINPLLGTASELVNRGENIIYYCTEEFRHKIERTGAEFKPYKGRINKIEVINDDMFGLFKLTLEMTVDKLNYNLDAIRDEKPDYIIHDSMCPWGKYIAAILNLPAVNLMHTFPVSESSTKITTDMIPMLFKIICFTIGSEFNKMSIKNLLKKDYSIKLDLRDFGINKEELNIIYTSKHMAPQVYESEKTYRFVGPSLFFKEESSDFPFESLKNNKVIYISLGTVHNNNPLFYKKCIQAFAEKEYFVVISTGQIKDMHLFFNAPKNFIIRSSVPQQRLLEQVDLFVTHAGMNGVNEAICRGVPMLLLPHQSEQKLIAKRVSEMGVGIPLNIKKITPKMIYQTAEMLISDSKYKHHAMEYSEVFKEEERTSHVRATDEILQYIGHS